MNFVDIVIVVLIAAIVGFSGWYVWKARKSGKKCIGCPDGGCDGNCCSCGKEK